MKPKPKVVQEVNYTVLAVMGGIHAIAPVAQEPCTDLMQWQVYTLRDRAGRRSRNLVGRVDWEGRVSSAVQSWDWMNRTATTHSGRVYRLLGESGYDREAEYVFGRWQDIHGVEVIRKDTHAVERLFARFALEGLATPSDKKQGCTA